MTFKMSEEAQTITIYNLRSDTQEFIGASDAYIPPHTGLPSYCTDIEPPKIIAGKVAVFDSVKRTWSLVEDHRGKIVFDTERGNEVFINELGELPKNTTSIAPDGEYQKWDGKAWGKDEEAEKAAILSDADAKKISLMQMANDNISTLERAVKFDMATDEEKNSLEAWEKYTVLLSRVKLEDAPNIEWPPKPE